MASSGKARRGRSSTSRRPGTVGDGQGRVRYAVVGLGHIAQVAVIPAFRHARSNSVLAAVVSDDAVKRRDVARRHRVPRAVGYEEYDALLGSGEIDAVYICLPNDQHRDYAIRAARAGVHVLCEKPLAVTEADCSAMIVAAARAGVRLMSAYRLHFERSNLTAVETVRAGDLGRPRIFSSVFTMQLAAGNIRSSPIARGGGTLYDIGIYCINAARYLFRAEPVEVVALSANGDKRRFRDIDETTSAILRFPDERLAAFTCSFGAASTGSFEVVGSEGHLRVESAYEYAAGSEHTLTIDDRKQRKRFAKRDQFAPELLHFSRCVLERRQPEPDGLEGLADVRIIRALYRSARTGRPVRLPELRKRRRPTLAAEIHRPALRKPKVTRARTASAD
jgi:predicted dehydrogenase